MKTFSNLIYHLSNIKEEQNKISLLRDYFSSEENSLDKDKALNLLLGKCPKRIISSKQLKSWSSELSGYSEWLIERSEKEVGNFVQTFCLLMRGDNSFYENISISDWLTKIIDLHKSTEISINEFLKKHLCHIDEDQRLNLLKLLTGTFKSPVTKNEIIVSISQLAVVKAEIVCLRLYNGEKKHSISMSHLLQESETESKLIPWNFPHIETIDKVPEIFMPHEKWEVFGYKQGIEVQLIKYENTIHLWTRENAIISDNFPEIIEAARSIKSNFIIYGQIVSKNHEKPIENINAKKSLEDASLVFEIWDILAGEECEIKTFESEHPGFNFKEAINFSSKEELESFHFKCRDHGFFGIYLREKKEATYYFWKANSFSVKAILMYVELGGLGKSGIISMTFGVFKGTEIVPIAKLSSFSDQVNITEIIDFVKANTLERFGPVRTVDPKLMYELYFDKVSKSSRRKSGLVLSNPEIKQKLEGKVTDANNLEYLEGLI